MLLHRAVGDDEHLRHRGIGTPFGHEAQHLAFARRERRERVRASLAAKHQRHDLGIECRAALGHAPHGVGEGPDIGDAVLEQVAGALGGLGQQLDRVGLLDVLREHEHRGVGVLGADPMRRAQAFIGVGRRMPTSITAMSGL